MKFYIAGIGENIEKYQFSLQKSVGLDDAETRLLSHKTRKSVKHCDLYRCASIKKQQGVKIDTDGDSFAHLQNRFP